MISIDSFTPKALHGRQVRFKAGLRRTLCNVNALNPHVTDDRKLINCRGCLRVLERRDRRGLEWETVA